MVWPLVCMQCYWAILFNNKSQGQNWKKKKQWLWEVLWKSGVVFSRPMGGWKRWLLKAYKWSTTLPPSFQPFSAIGRTKLSSNWRRALFRERVLSEQQLRAFARLENWRGGRALCTAFVRPKKAGRVKKRNESLTKDRRERETRKRIVGEFLSSWCTTRSCGVPLAVFVQFVLNFCYIVVCFCWYLMRCVLLSLLFSGQGVLLFRWPDRSRYNHLHSALLALQVCRPGEHRIDLLKWWQPSWQRWKSRTVHSAGQWVKSTETTVSFRLVQEHKKKLLHWWKSVAFLHGCRFLNVCPSHSKGFIFQTFYIFFKNCILFYFLSILHLFILCSCILDGPFHFAQGLLNSHHGVQHTLCSHGGCLLNSHCGVYRTLMPLLHFSLNTTPHVHTLMTAWFMIRCGRHSSNPDWSWYWAKLYELFAFIFLAILYQSKLRSMLWRLCVLLSDVFLWKIYPGDRRLPG